MVGATLDELRHRDLPNWGRYSRSYLPPLNEAMNPIYDFIVHDDDDEGHGQILDLLAMVQAGKVPLSLIANFRPGMQQADESPVREKDALELNEHLTKMMHQAENSRRTKRNYRIIKNQFYRQEVTKRGRPWTLKPEDVDDAIHALMNLIFGVEKQRI
jgi:hypothetical protein